ncbi:hypothetical protein LSH36_454g00009 [Paralvinella palmiformis]|uniref:Uncharacterized protein n=1 Tax=Paralvinella palmiformis TaxID=53620 RepID=A0AAD9JA17_9ANNE|nr:hypothetical protein LSH36_454g00009 [Paralvinella palmiformis]
MYAYHFGDGDKCKQNFDSGGDYGVGLHIVEYMIDNTIDSSILIAAHHCSADLKPYKVQNEKRSKIDSPGYKVHDIQIVCPTVIGQMHKKDLNPLYHILSRHYVQTHTFCLCFTVIGGIEPVVQEIGRRHI